jgi:hypothetical protein
VVGGRQLQQMQHMSTQQQQTNKSAAVKQHKMALKFKSRKVGQVRQAIQKGIPSAPESHHLLLLGMRLLRRRRTHRSRSRLHFRHTAQDKRKVDRFAVYVAPAALRAVLFPPPRQKLPFRESFISISGDHCDILADGLFSAK